MEIEFSTKTHLEEHLEYYTNNIHTLNEPNTVLLRRSIIEYYIQLKKNIRSNRNAFFAQHSLAAHTIQYMH